MRLQRVSLLSIQLPCLSTNLPRTGTLTVPPHIRSTMYDALNTTRDRESSCALREHFYIYTRYTE